MNQGKRTHIVTRAREGVNLLANLRSRPSVIVGDDDLRCRNVCAEQGEGKSERAHDFGGVKECAPGV